MSAVNVSSITVSDDLVILCEEMNQVYRTSTDHGTTFGVHTVDFYPTLAKISPYNASQVMMYDGRQYDLRLSLDMANTWKLLLRNCIHGDRFTPNAFEFGVQPFDPPGMIYAINQSANMGGSLDRCLMYTKNFGETMKTERCHVKSFEITKQFKTVTTPYALHVGHTINGHGSRFMEQAIFPVPDTNIEKGWEVLDESEGLLFVVVDHRVANYSNVSGKVWTGSTNLYVSGDAGLRYTLSLPNILYARQKGTQIANVDFLSVTDLEGVFLATEHISQSKNASSGSHRTVITFNKGSGWKYLPAPTVDAGGQAVDCQLINNCSLSLHLNEVPLATSAPIQSPLPAIYAPGMILATGSMGTTLQLDANLCSVFLSSNGGSTWDMILQGPHYYTFANRGSIIVAISYSDPTTLKWSFDYGKTFQSKPLAMPAMAKPTDGSTNTLIINSLTSPPMVHGAVAIISGRQSWNGDPVNIEVDFSDIISSKCTLKDYELWSPTTSSFTDGVCWLGSRVQYTRRKQTSVCIEDTTDNLIPAAPMTRISCACTPMDYECDNGYDRQPDGTCVSSDELDIADESGSGFDGAPTVPPTPAPVNPFFQSEFVPYNCQPGMMWNYTMGYRLIPGDRCVGCAFDSCELKPCPSTDNVEAPPTLPPTNSNTPPATLSPSQSGYNAGISTTPASAASHSPINPTTTYIIVGVVVGVVALSVGIFILLKQKTSKRLRKYVSITGISKNYEQPQVKNPTYAEDDPMVAGGMILVERNEEYENEEV